MSAPNPFEAPAAPSRAAPEVRPFRAVDVLRAGTGALLSAWAGLAAVVGGAVVVVLLGCGLWAFPGVALAPAAVASVVGALLAAADGRSVFEVWMSPYRRWRALWRPGAHLLAVAAVVVGLTRIPGLLAPALLGRWAIAVTLPVWVASRALALVGWLAAFAWVESTTSPGVGLWRGWDVVRASPGATAAVAVVEALAGTATNLLTFGALARVAPPSSASLGAATAWVVAPQATAAVLGVWGGLVAAAVWRTQVGSDEGAPARG